jgi:hypothetical protein
MLLVLVSGSVFYLALEGGYALSKGKKPSRSLLYGFLEQRKHDPPSEALPNYLHSQKELDERLPLFERNRVLLGNSPYDELFTEETRVTVSDAAVGKRFKPNLTIRTAQLRSRIFKPLNPLSYTYVLREGVEPEPELLDFLARYALQEITWSTDADGFRTTLPVVEAERVILLVGSSPCAGLYVADDETLASVLQSRDSSVRYINACVPATSVESHAAMAAEMVERLGDRLVGVIYTINNFNYDSREEALAAVDAIAAQMDEITADYRVLIHFDYIYETMPDVFRKNRKLKRFFADKAAIMARAQERGFATVDSYDVVDAYRTRQRSLGSGLALYTDHGHLSRLGTQLVANAMPPRGPGPRRPRSALGRN